MTEYETHVDLARRAEARGDFEAAAIRWELARRNAAIFGLDLHATGEEST